MSALPVLNVFAWNAFVWTFRVILHAPIAPARLTSSAQPALSENYGLAITINTRQPQCPFIVEPSSFGFDKTPPAGRALTHIK